MNETITITPLLLSALLAEVAIIGGGLYGLYLLIRRMATLQSQWRQWISTRSALLAEAPAGRLDSRPLLTLLLAWSLLLIIQRLSPPAANPAELPQVPTLLFSFFLQHGVALLVIGSTLLLAGEPLSRYLSCNPETSWQAAVVSGLQGGVMLLPPVWLLGWINHALLKFAGLEPQLQEAFLWLRHTDFSLLGKLLLIAAALIAAPLIEEALFRLLLLPALAREGECPLRATLLSALLFALLHNHEAALLPLLAIGIGCGCGYLTTGHLLTPVVMHLVVNAVSLLAFYATMQL